MPQGHDEESSQGTPVSREPDWGALWRKALELLRSRGRAAWQSADYEDMAQTAVMKVINIYQSKHGMEHVVGALDTDALMDEHFAKWFSTVVRNVANDYWRIRCRDQGYVAQPRDCRGTTGARRRISRSEGNKANYVMQAPDHEDNPSAVDGVQRLESLELQSTDGPTESDPDDERTYVGRAPDQADDLPAEEADLLQTLDAKRVLEHTDLSHKERVALWLDLCGYESAEIAGRVASTVRQRLTDASRPNSTELKSLYINLLSLRHDWHLSDDDIADVFREGVEPSTVRGWLLKARRKLRESANPDTSRRTRGQRSAPRKSDTSTRRKNTHGR